MIKPVKTMAKAADITSKLITCARTSSSDGRACAHLHFKHLISCALRAFTYTTLSDYAMSREGSTRNIACAARLERTRHGAPSYHWLQP